MNAEERRNAMAAANGGRVIVGATKQMEIGTIVRTNNLEPESKEMQLRIVGEASLDDLEREIKAGRGEPRWIVVDLHWYWAEALD
jgi:hypothetical protein